MAPDRRSPPRAREPHLAAPATLFARAEPHGERLGIPAREQTMPPGLGQLRGNPSGLPGSLELPHRRPRSDTHHRRPRVGVCQCLGRLVSYQPAKPMTASVAGGTDVLPTVTRTTDKG